MINQSNVNLLERQVETDSIRLDKGEISLADLAQSESSLAGAKANFIQSQNEVITNKLNYENVIGPLQKINSLKKSQEPFLSKFTLKTKVSVTIGLKFVGEVWIISDSSLLYLLEVVIVSTLKPSLMLGNNLEKELLNSGCSLRLIIDVSTVLVNKT